MRSLVLIMVSGAAGDSTPACPTGYNDYLPGSPHGKCFQILHDKTWSECRASCTAIGGAQLCLHSDAESVFVRDLLGMSRRCCYWNDKSCCTWLGLHQADPTQGAARCRAHTLSL